jgi:hypothetical protein
MGIEYAFTAGIRFLFVALSIDPITAHGALLLFIFSAALYNPSNDGPESVCESTIIGSVK